MSTKSFYGMGQGSFYGGGMYGSGQSSTEAIEKELGPASIVSFNDGLKNKPLEECVVNIEPVQSGSGDPSPSNVRPISGWTGANIYVSPTDDPADGRTYSVTFPAAAGTVYGGTLDVTAGTLTVTYGFRQLSATVMNQYGTTSKGMPYARFVTTSDVAESGDIYCDRYTCTRGAGTTFSAIRVTSSGATYIYDNRFTDETTAQQILDAEKPVLIYPLETPVVYQLTPQQITTLSGTNNIWADTGDIIIKYPTKVEYETKTVSGNPIHINDGMNAPVKKMNLSIEPVQDLHGYDSPWPAGGGRNLVPLFVSETINDVTLTNNNGEITLNGTASADATFDVSTDFLIPNGSTYYLCCFNPVASESSRLSLFAITETGTENPQKNMNVVNGSSSATVSSDMHIIKFRIRAPEGIQLNNFKLSPMFQIGGTQPTVWTPYSNICPITGWTGAKVTTVGASMLDGVVMESGYINETGEKRPSLNLMRTAEPISATPGRAYAIRCVSAMSASFRVRVHEYDASGNWLRQIFVSDGFSAPDVCAVILVVSNDAAYIAFSVPIYSELTAVWDATDYSITFPTEAGTVYGGTLDVTSGVLTVDRAMVDLGTLTYPEKYSVTQGTMFRSSTIDGAKLENNGTNFICSNYKASNQSNRANGTISIPSSGKIDIVDNRYADASTAEFKTAMSGVQLVYELATPVTYQLTPQQIELLFGENNIWTDVNNIDLLKYKGQK